MKGGIAHWDEIEPVRRERGHIAGSWRDLGRAAGSINVGVKRMEIDPGKWSTPVHLQTAEEEIFYVLDGSGLSWQDGKVHEVRRGDCIVHTAGTEAHTLRAGPEGLDVLAYGMRIRTELGYLPRARVGWLYPTWVTVGEQPTPWDREVAAGEPEVGEPSPRPDWVVNADQLDGDRMKELGDAAGSERTGLNWISLPPGDTGPPAHCHSVEEEIFIVLDGDGTLELRPAPIARDRGASEEQHAVTAGSVIARPAGTRMAHALRAGAGGLTYLAYGTRDPSDMAYYPRSNKIFFRGVGVIARLEHVDYMDGEEP